MTQSGHCRNPLQATQIHCIRLSMTTALQVLACYLCLTRAVSVEQMGKLFDELKRRSDIRVAIAYVIVAWLIAQVTETALDSFAVPSTEFER